MTFVPKNIFLADDDSPFRILLKTVLESHGHRVLVEAKNGDEARLWAPKAAEMGIEVAVLDCNMPKETDGPEIASALNIAIPHLLVVSVSDRWRGLWDDPNYDKEHLHSINVNRYDINGRMPMKGPDFSARAVRFDHEKIAGFIGEWEFSLVNREGMENIQEIEKMNARYKERK